MTLTNGVSLVVALTLDTMWNGAPAPPSHAIDVVLLDGGQQLVVQVDAPFHGDPPPGSPPGPLWGLWNFEVVEVFISGFGEPEPYLELEIGPHGHHLAIQLRGERSVLASCLPVDLQAEIRGDRWRATARIDRRFLPPPPHRLNVTAIHGVGEARRYLSWAPLPGERPDFHQLGALRAVTLP